MFSSAFCVICSPSLVFLRCVWLFPQNLRLHSRCRDWFHILDVPSTPPVSEWAGLESRVEQTTNQMLDMFAEQQVKCTLFVLSWVAERFPKLVQRAANDGHEIASHGYAHELVYHIGEEQFTEDVRKAKGILKMLPVNKLSGTELQASL